MRWRRRFPRIDDGVPDLHDSPRGSVFRSFAVKGFQPWPTWDRLRRILSTNGGCFGIVGSRGAGKSWLMQRAIEHGRSVGGIGLWFPSPSEDDAEAFLSALSDNFAAEILELIQRRRRHAFSPQVLRLGGISLSLLLFIIILFNEYPYVRADTVTGVVVAATVAGSTALLLIALFLAVGALSRTGRLRTSALDLRERIRFSATLRETGEAGVSGARGLLSFKSARERQLIERPTTVTSLVHDFRDLAEECVRALRQRPVIIAIDELDKMSDPDEVRALLRDVKGIFEIPGVHFLVSVSHEAARALKLAGVAERNEFNSSFYTVIELPPLAPEAGAAMLLERSRLADDERVRYLQQLRQTGQLRGYEAKELRWLLASESHHAPFPLADQAVAVAVSVLAAGNPREAVRLYDLAAQARNGTTSPSQASAAAMRLILTMELRELRRIALEFDGVDGIGRLSEQEQTGLFLQVERATREDIDLASHAQELLRGAWTPIWQGSAWQTRFAEHWRRLIVRYYVAGFIAANPGVLEAPATTLRLTDIVSRARESAAVARIMLADEPCRAVPPGKERRAALLTRRFVPRPRGG